MRKEERVRRLLQTLDDLYPDAKCELVYHNNFELLVAVVLSAQTTDQSVNSVTPKLFARYPGPAEMAAADEKELAGYIRRLGLYQSKARNLIALSKKLVSDYEGTVPASRAELLTLPGVGRKTSNVVLSVAFDVPAFAVDTHVERVAKRLKLAKADDSVLDVERKLCRAIPRERWNHTHHQMIFFGRHFCKAAKPSCQQCPLFDICGADIKNKFRS